MTIQTVYLANVTTMYLVGINEWLLHSFPNRVISPYREHPSIHMLQKYTYYHVFLLVQVIHYGSNLNSVYT